MRFFDLPVLPAKGIERFLTGLLVYFFIQEHAVLVFFLPCLTLCLLAAWGMSAAARNVWVSTIFSWQRVGVWTAWRLLHLGHILAFFDGPIPELLLRLLGSHLFSWGDRSRDRSLSCCLGVSVLRFAMASEKAACEPKKVFDLEWVSSFMKDQEVQSRAKQILQERCERNHPKSFSSVREKNGYLT